MDYASKCKEVALVFENRCEEYREYLDRKEYRKAESVNRYLTGFVRALMIFDPEIDMEIAREIMRQDELQDELAEALDKLGKGEN